MSQKMEITKVRDTNEIDLLDLLKIILRNKKLIIMVWVIVAVLGLIFGFYKKNSSDLQTERKFEIKTISEEIGEINPIDFFDNQEFVDGFYEEKLIQELSKDIQEKSALVKRNFIKELLKVSLNNKEYALKLSGKNFSEIEKLEKIYFDRVSNHVESVYGGIIKKDLETVKNQTEVNKKELSRLEQIIRDLAKTITDKNDLASLKDIYPSIFAEKDAIASIYGENYKEQKTLEGNLIQLQEVVRMKSSLNEVENKMSTILIFIIANVLGLFLGVFAVFVKEFMKSINWKELKNI